MRKKHFWVLFIIWVSILIFSFFWNVYLVKSGNKNLVLNKSRAFFNQILVTRMWNAEHGGVYVPVTPTSQPNIYLEDSLRDLQTTSGLKLTKINPAYMTRQIAEMNDKINRLHFHITSLNPIRPENKADQWESKSLMMFENGVAENLELIKNDSSYVYRYIAPLITENSCLKCHSKQGYKKGDIRGGISITYSAKDYQNSVNKQITSLGVIHLIIFIMGISGLTYYYRMANKYLLIIENRNKELEQTNAAKDKFFSIIAHDLKAPFNSILGFSEILVENIDKENNIDKLRYAKIIHENSEQAFLLINNLLEWSRTQSSRIQFNPIDYNLKDEVNEIVDLLSNSALQKSIVIENNINESLMVYADKDMINTVLRNLITNAVKFTNTGGKIVISVDKTADNVIVKISDNGVGISQDRINKLFMINENYSTNGTQNEKGTGLGLILCKEFVEKNEGKIWVDSTEGSGTTFCFSLIAKSS